MLVPRSLEGGSSSVNGCRGIATRPEAGDLDWLEDIPGPMEPIRQDVPSRVESENGTRGPEEGPDQRSSAAVEVFRRQPTH